MIEKKDIPFDKYSDRWLIANYLKYGSVEAVMCAYDYSIPCSVADYHRRVRKAGIVKGDGRANKSFAQALYVFLEKTLQPSLSLEKIYRSLPLTLRDARMSSIYRIYDSIMKQKTRRAAVGVVISPEGRPGTILVADELRSSSTSAKKSGETTIPFGFASKKHSFDRSLLRIMQREFSTTLALSGELVVGSEMSSKLIPADTRPFLELQLLDVRVSVAHLTLPGELCDLSKCTSFTVNNHRWVPLEDCVNGKVGLRTGVGEVLASYHDFLFKSSFSTKFEIADINRALLTLI